MKATGARRTLAAAFTIALVLACGAPALAYLKLGFDLDGRRGSLRWTRTPVQYYVTERGVPGVSVANLQLALSRAFSSWEEVPTSSVSYQSAGLTSSLPGTDDGRSTLGFLSRPELDRVLASTSFLIDGETGELMEADIFFNSAFQWSVMPGGEAGRFDLESIALHEIGHMSGLGHSALGETELSAGGRRVIAAESVMFPTAFSAGSVTDRMLRPDDRAGISDVYPEPHFNDDTGSVSGRVTLNGRGVFGAHIVAFHLLTGALIGNFSLNEEGQFSIAGLSPGPHILRVEPLDDADVDGFFPADVPVELGFRVTYPQRLVVVPRGGDSGTVEIEVDAK
jgi:hypothetical protein